MQLVQCSVLFMRVSGRAWQLHSLGEYGANGIVGYIAFNQAILWITQFTTNGLGLEQAVRTGQIAVDLMRPVHLFYQAMSREWGQVWYQFLYKCIPIYVLYVFIFSLQLPHARFGLWLDSDFARLWPLISPFA